MQVIVKLPVTRELTICRRFVFITLYICIVLYMKQVLQHRKNIPSIFTRSSKADSSKFLENLEENSFYLSVLFAVLSVLG